MRSSVPSELHKSRKSKSVLRGGRSFGIARHWHPVLKIYMIPFIPSRTSTWRLLPPRLAGGINGSTYAHSSSVRVTRISQFAAVVTSAVLRRPHRGAPLESGHHFESQTIQRIQNVFGRTLRLSSPDRNVSKAAHVSVKRTITIRAIAT